MVDNANESADKGFSHIRKESIAPDILLPLHRI